MRIYVAYIENTYQRLVHTHIMPCPDHAISLNI